MKNTKLLSIIVKLLWSILLEYSVILTMVKSELNTKFCTIFTIVRLKIVHYSMQK